MTIQNVFEKCEQIKMIFPSLTAFSYEDFDDIKNYNKTDLAGEKAAVQLKIIYKCMKNFIDLRREYLASLKDMKKCIDPSIRERSYFP